ncbi:hypothetical protein ACN4EG_26780 [Alkalinema pantanalense CENA528]|uniref:hypothetical protein n=1 Tax=Alkalinema pantanalense TaxID=1620705 RepID=UPI003D6EBA78
MSQRDDRVYIGHMIDTVNKAIAFVLVKTISTLMWLALNQEQPFRQRLVAEMKQFALNYLQIYFPSSYLPDENLGRKN